MRKIPVVLLKCSSYSILEVEKAVERALTLLRLEEEIKRSKKPLLLKPNLLSPVPPQRGVTTHPVFVEGVVKVLKKMGKEVMIGDSPGGIGTSVEEVWEITGMKKIAQKYSIPLLNFSKEKLKKVDLPHLPFSLYIPEVIFSSHLISLPKLKTHHLTLLTAGIKNIFGVIPGTAKIQIHREFPHPKQFSRFLVNLYSLVNPYLTIVDGIEAMEGEGPSQGKIRNLGWIIASGSGIAVDMVIGKLLGINPLKIPTNLQSYIQTGIELSHIEILGNSFSPLKDFLFPTIPFLLNLPPFLLKMLSFLIKIQLEINLELCQNCERCLRSCPVGAIFRDSKERLQIDRRKCIQCLCCFEICPSQAVNIKKRLLARWWK